MFCRLNERYFEALKACPLKLYNNRDGYGINVHKPYDILALHERKLSCCGINELVFSNMIGYEAGQQWPDDEYKAILAGLIWYGAGNPLPYTGQEAKDGRILIASMVQYSDASHKVYTDYYERIRVILLEFGFKQVNKIPYVNANSDHKIIGMIGRMPTPQKYVQPTEVVATT